MIIITYVIWQTCGCDNLVKNCSLIQLKYSHVLNVGKQFRWCSRWRKRCLKYLLNSFPLVGDGFLTICMRNSSKSKSSSKQTLTFLFGMPVSWLTESVNLILSTVCVEFSEWTTEGTSDVVTTAASFLGLHGLAGLSAFTCGIVTTGCNFKSMPGNLTFFWKSLKFFETFSMTPFILECTTIVIVFCAPIHHYLDHDPPPQYVQFCVQCFYLDQKQ